MINMGEVLSILLKHLDEQRAPHSIQVLQHAVTMVEADVRRTIEAARLKHQYKLGYADSFAASLAMTSKSTLVSGDAAFERVGKSLKWMRLPQSVAKSR